MGGHSNSEGRYPEFWKDLLWGGIPTAIVALLGVSTGLAVAYQLDLPNRGATPAVITPIPNATNYPVPHTQPSKRPIGQNPTCWIDRNPAWPDC